MKERPDAEIAAHLGEVLWAKGEHDARAGRLAVAAQDHARQPGAARDGAPPRALMPLRAHAPRVRGRLRRRAAAPRAPPPARAAASTPVPAAFDRAAACRRGAATRRWRSISRGATRRTATASTLSTPLGQIVARMRGDGARVRVERPAARRCRMPTGAQSRRGLGVAIPVDGLAAWMQGAPAAGGAFDLERDAQGRPLVLRQRGWEIVYSYGDASARPTRLVMRYPGSEPVEVRIVVDRFCESARESGAAATLVGHRAGEGQPVPARHGSPCPTAITRSSRCSR